MASMQDACQQLEISFSSLICMFADLIQGFKIGVIEKRTAQAGSPGSCNIA